MRRFFLSLLILLLVLQVVNAGVTHPLPSEIELLKGESGRFKFQIQAVAHPESVVCHLSLEKAADFEISFDENDVIIEGGTIKEIYGTVSAPRRLDYGKYSASFCVACDKLEGSPGVSVKVNTCGLPINVEVVKQRTRQNMNIPPKPFPTLLVSLIAAVIIILILLSIIIYLILKTKPKKHKKTRHKK